MYYLDIFFKRITLYFRIIILISTVDVNVFIIVMFLLVTKRIMDPVIS